MARGKSDALAYLIGEGEEQTRQRGERGYSEEDTFSFDTYLAGVIAGGVRRLRERSIGYPHEFAQPDDPEGEKAGAAWDAVLEEIAEGFEWYVEGKFTAREIPPEFERAFDLFRKHFSSLWD